jgi:oligopeptide/dipeptide ABC transporter ATP-binding protein
MTEQAKPGEILLEVKDLKTWFPIKAGFLQMVVGHVKAVDGVDLYIRRGETLGLVGESGCGKTTLGRTVLRLIKATGGQVLYRTNGTGSASNVLTMNTAELFSMRKRMQIIFQDPFSSLNPRMSVGDIVGEYMQIHKVADRQNRIVELLESVGLNPAYLYRYPHEFSGGQRQRLGIARALSLDPEFIVCDEPVSALDVSVQAQILKLLQGLQQKMGLTYLFISHDLNVVRHLSDRVAVMYVGKLVEHGPVNEIYRRPCHPYTEALLSAIPRYRTSGPGLAARILLQGDVPSPARPPSGCRFHPRCRHAQEICKQEMPPLSPVMGASERYAACHFADKLELSGV